MKLIVITFPESLNDEALICNSLFAHGLELLHLRKPEASESVYRKFIEQIEPRYHNRIVVHDYYELVMKYGLHGIHLRSGMIYGYDPDPRIRHISISCHDAKEVMNIPLQVDYCFLSPIFDSISKTGYRSRFNKIPDVSGSSLPIIALGGITGDNMQKCLDRGFAGVAVIGYIWQQPEEALQRFIRLATPFVMSIAGFDPSSGAGVTADIKTFEATGSYGLGVISAITLQNEEEYNGTVWTNFDTIRKQCSLQFKKHHPAYIKIGLIKNLGILDQLITYLTDTLPYVKIIWDPILKASAGFVFHEGINATNKDQLNHILNGLYLITPNAEELVELFGQDITTEELEKFSKTHQINILRKGGHDDTPLSTDHLITPEGVHTFSVRRNRYSKHGTGCILSSAITSALARGYSLPEACDKAQLYVSNIINSNDNLLAYHTIGQHPQNNKPLPCDLNLQYITAPKEDMTLCEQAEAACRGGIRWIQLRMKKTKDGDILREGRQMKEICRRYNALFIINDNVQIARQLEADGVHLGKEDMDPEEARKILGHDKVIGATCNTWKDILLRQKQQVNYIGLGPFTFTTTKKKLSPVLGLQGYKTLMAQMQEAGIHIPVYAIGGITEADIPSLMQTGIQGIALSGLIKNSEDITLKTKEIITILNYKQ